MFLIRELALGEVGPPPLHKGNYGSNHLVVLFLRENPAEMDGDGVLVLLHGVSSFSYGPCASLQVLRGEEEGGFVVGVRAFGFLGLRDYPEFRSFRWLIHFTSRSLTWQR